MLLPMWPAAKRRIAGVVIAAIGATLVAGTVWWFWVADSENTDVGALHDVTPESVLAAGRLPPLPDGAKDVMASRWSGFYTGASYRCFRASEDAARDFIEAADVEPTDCRPFQRHDSIPDWFVPERLSTPRCFEISPVRNHGWGTVWVEGESVFVEVVWS